jgi:hypothetical protein
MRCSRNVLNIQFNVCTCERRRDENSDCDRRKISEGFVKLSGFAPFLIIPLHKDYAFEFSFTFSSLQSNMRNIWGGSIRIFDKLFINGT